MAKDPAFLFYYDRFISGTYTMTNEEVGFYIRLLCIQANRGYVTEKDMNNTSYSSVEDIRKKFSEIAPGVYRNEVLFTIMEDRKKFTESRRNNRLGKKKSEENEEQVNNTSYSSEKLVVNVNKDINSNRKRLNITFDEFWNLYDKKVGDKGKLEKKWASLTDDERSKAMWHIPQYKAAQPDKQYRKDPGTYLNNKSFNDEIIKNGTTATAAGYVRKPTGGELQAELLAKSLQELNARRGQNS